MSVARIAFGTVLAGILITAAGCRVEVTTKERYLEPACLGGGNLTCLERTDTQDWAGQEIEIDIAGVGLSVNGGVEVTARPEVTKVTASARMLAMGFPEDKPMAELSLSEAKDTYKITNTPQKITVACGHGGSHASSSAGESGCELVKVSVPTGSADRPLSITIKGGNGNMTVQLFGATIKNVGVSNQSDINAEFPVTQGANIQVTGHKSSDVAVTMPQDFAADKIRIEADADKIVNGFSDATIDGSAGRGTPGTGLTNLTITSISFAGSTGQVTLRGR